MQLDSLKALHENANASVMPVERLWNAVGTSSERLQNACRLSLERAWNGFGTLFA